MLNLSATRPSLNIKMMGVVMIGVIGIIDYLIKYFISPEITTALFYVVPVGICSWRNSRWSGYFLSLLAFLVWYTADFYSGQLYSSPLILYWNAFMRLVLFLIIAHLLSSYKAQLVKQAEAAETDALTGVLNSRGFYALAERERDRSQRFGNPFTIAYMDLDNFKQVNDTLGHQAGDELLRKVASLMKAHSRKSDLVARLGGDEFAMLFVQTDHNTASAAITKVRQHLFAEMKRLDSPVTFSIGAVTYLQAPASVEIMVKQADNLMYAVKKKSKNAVEHIVCDGSHE